MCWRFDVTWLFIMLLIIMPLVMMGRFLNHSSSALITMTIASLRLTPTKNDINDRDARERVLDEEDTRW